MIHAPAALLSILFPVALSTGDIVVYRCASDDGSVSFQDEPCAGGQQQREQRYEAPPPREPAPMPREPALEPEAAPDPIEEAAVEEAVQSEPSPAPTLVPPLFTCATFDGDVYVSELGDGNRRCVPLQITRIGSGPLPGSAQACEWVVDDCRLLESTAACDGWQTLQRRARRSEREAASSDLVEVRENLRRLTAIRDSACAR